MSSPLDRVEWAQLGPQPDPSVNFYSTTLDTLDSVCLFQPSFDEFRDLGGHELNFEGNYFPKEGPPFPVIFRFSFEGDKAYWDNQNDYEALVVLPAHVLDTLKFEALRFRGLFEARLELRRRTRAAVDRFSERNIAKAMA